MAATIPADIGLVWSNEYTKMIIGISSTQASGLTNPRVNTANPAKYPRNDIRRFKISI